MANERTFDIEVALQTRIDTCLLTINRLAEQIAQARCDGDEKDLRWFLGQKLSMDIFLEELEYLLTRVKEG